MIWLLIGCAVLAWLIALVGIGCAMAAGKEMPARDS